jgi:ABC-2 type transport system ATP-binding protein
MTAPEIQSFAETQTAAIEINNLVVTYGNKPAVNGLSLRVPVGAVFGFLGPNSGSARVLGYDVATQSLEVRARTGYVSEVNSLYDYLTIPQICAFCRRTSRRWNQGIVDRYLDIFALPRRSKIDKLSRGMKSQLALSLALGSDPDLLILDEPTAGLDPIARHQFLNKLVGEVAAAGKTVFFSSHLLAEVEAIADWVGIIQGGRLVVSDELDHLKLSQKALRLTYAEVPPSTEIAALRALPNVVSVTQEGRSVRLLVHGDVDALAHRSRSKLRSPCATWRVSTSISKTSSSNT